jgi:hypothetical protein
LPEIVRVELYITVIKYVIKNFRGKMFFLIIVSEDSAQRGEEGIVKRSSIMAARKQGGRMPVLLGSLLFSLLFHSGHPTRASLPLEKSLQTCPEVWFSNLLVCFLIFSPIRFTVKINHHKPGCWHMSVITPLEKWRQEECEFEARLDYIARSHVKKEKKKLTPVSHNNQ